MTSDTELAKEQDLFRSHVMAGEAIMRSDSPDVTGANSHVDATGALVNEWANRDIVKDVLLPLLADAEVPAIRCTAASYLLYHGEADKARLVLEELVRKSGIGMVGSQARIALIGWRKKHQAEA